MNNGKIMKSDDPSPRDTRRYLQFMDFGGCRQIMDWLRRVSVKILSRMWEKRSRRCCQSKVSSHRQTQVKSKGNYEVREAACSRTSWFLECRCERSCASNKPLVSSIGYLHWQLIAVIEPSFCKCTKVHFTEQEQHLLVHVSRGCQSGCRYLGSLREMLSFPWCPRKI